MKSNQNFATGDDKEDPFKKKKKHPGVGYDSSVRHLCMGFGDGMAPAV